MAKLRDYDLTTLMNNLRVFEYEREGQTIRAEFFPSSRGKNIAMILESMYGTLKADEIFYKPYEAGLLSENMLAATIADKNRDNWIHLLGITKSEYNPIWNVDGTVETITETEYGKNTTLQNGKVITTEQIEDGSTKTIHGKTITTEQLEEATTETEYGKVSTSEQLATGRSETQHGLIVENDQIEDAVSKEKVSAFNNSSLVQKSQNETDGGKVKTTNSGTDVVLNSDGKKQLSDTGKDTITVDGGKMEVSEGGMDEIQTNTGKSEVKNTGDDITKESGKDTQKITEKRGGNIGVTMTQQLLSAEADFWSQWNFFDAWFKSIIKVITIPIFEED